MINIWKKLSIVILILAFGMLPFVAGAQGFGLNSFFLTLSPSSPGPGSSFSAQVSSSSFDINNSNIRWLVDGSLELSGVGETLISLEAPGAGGSMRIEVLITTPDDESLSKSITVRPVGVDLLWESNTYTPPFYKGKALYTYRSPVRVVAVPRTSASQRISFLPRNNLNYRWSLGGEVIPGSSGFGKNVFEFVPKEVSPRALLVEVRILDGEGDLVASGGTFITENNPKITLYEESPLLGKLSNRALGEDYLLDKDEVSIRAEPFFFTSNDLRSGKLNFNWRLNRESFEVGGDPSLVVFGKGEGVSLIELTVNNPIRIIQEAFVRLRITND